MEGRAIGYRSMQAGYNVHVRHDVVFFEADSEAQADHAAPRTSHQSASRRSTQSPYTLHQSGFDIRAPVIGLTLIRLNQSALRCHGDHPIDSLIESNCAA
jgi:hypothetical protein